MRAKSAAIIAMILISGLWSKIVAADVNIGVSADENGIKEFYLAIGDFYKTPEKEVVVVRQKGIPDDDIPVVYFIARRANIDPLTIIQLRLAGASWMEISLRYGLTADIYYVDIHGDPGPPYGKAYGYYRKHPRKKWNEIRLSDPDIVNLVNLRFLSEHYGHSPNEIIKMRSGGESFVKINGNVKHGKANKGKAEKKKAAVKKQKATEKARKK